MVTGWTFVRPVFSFGRKKTGDEPCGASPDFFVLSFLKKDYLRNPSAFTIAR